MSKKWIWIVLALLALGAVVAFMISSDDPAAPAQETSDNTQEGELSEEFLAQEQAEQEATESQGATVEVSYTENGFEPSTVTINVGDTVTWTNNTNSAMQVASDDHPDHTDYPGFDQLSAGSSYSFTFDQAGTWGYHNHEDHNVTGTVIVN